MRYLANFMLLVEYHLYMEVANQMYEDYHASYRPYDPDYATLDRARELSLHAQWCLEQYQNFQP